MPRKIDDRVYVLTMNKGSAYNTLSTSYMNKIRDYFVYYEASPMLKAFVFQAMDQQIFSLGNDYKHLSYLRQAAKTDEIAKYLNDVCGFAHFMASYNKPFLQYTNGLLLNSAASIFLQVPFAYDKGQTRMAFNEGDFGSLPMAGTSYFLSRMTGEIGTFFALTGAQTQGDDLCYLKLVRGRNNFSTGDLHTLGDALRGSVDFHGYDLGYKPMFPHKLSRKIDINNSVEEFLKRSKEENPKKVMLDLYYRKKLLESADMRMREWQDGPDKTPLEDQLRMASLQNNLFSFEQVAKTVMEENLEISGANGLAARNLPAINECFSKDTIEEIEEALKKNGTPFARECLSLMRARNRKIQQLILNCLRKALNFDMMECMEYEYRVNMALVESPHVRNLFTKEFFTTDEFSIEEIEKAAEERLPNGHLKHKLSIKYQPDSMLPTSKFYSKFPECFRTYFNETEVRDPVLRDGYSETIKSVLLRLGIDHVNPTYDKAFVRRMLRRQLDAQFLIDKKAERMRELIESSALRRQYFGSREEEIKKLEGENGTKMVEEAILETLEASIRETIDLMRERAAEVNRVLRADQLEEIKNFIIDNRFFSKAVKEFTPEVKKNFFEAMSNLPLEITGRRDRLSPGFRKLIGFDELKAKIQPKVTGVDLDFAKGSVFSRRVVSVQEAQTVIYDLNRMFHEQFDERLFNKDNQILRRYAYARPHKLRYYELLFQNRFIRGLLRDYERKKGPVPIVIKEAIYKRVSKEFFITVDWKNREGFIQMSQRPGGIDFSAKRHPYPKQFKIANDPKFGRLQAKAFEDIEKLLESISNADLSAVDFEKINSPAKLLKVLKANGLLIGEVSDLLCTLRGKFTKNIKKQMFEKFISSFAYKKHQTNLTDSKFTAWTHSQHQQLTQEILFTCLKEIYQGIGTTGLKQMSKILRVYEKVQKASRGRAGGKQIQRALSRAGLTIVGYATPKSIKKRIGEILKTLFFAIGYGNTRTAKTPVLKQEPLFATYALARKQIKRRIAALTQSKKISIPTSSTVFTAHTTHFLSAIKLEKAMLTLYKGGPSGLEDFYYQWLVHPRVPDYFEEMDIRQTAENWLRFNVSLYTRALLQMRSRLEPHLEVGELSALDQRLSNLLKPQALAVIMRKKLVSEQWALNALAGLSQQSSEKNVSFESLIGYEDTAEGRMKDQIKDENAYKLLLAMEAFVLGDATVDQLTMKRDFYFMLDLAKKAFEDNKPAPDKTFNLHEAENLSKIKRKATPFDRFVQKDGLDRTPEIKEIDRTTDIFKEIAYEFKEKNSGKLATNFQRIFDESFESKHN